ncbi:MAG: NUDIX hydrolase YfcD [Deltaproteobacteria bacterium]|nr:NUDIX hydrolase YfcD [Deltaproteobacteria bacterium]
MAAEEVVDVVDEHDQVIGQATRRQMRAQQLRHRSCYILLFNQQSQLFVHRRTAGKDIYPGCFDVAFGGVVAAGEDYDGAAQRELSEEAGVRGVSLRRVLTFQFNDSGNHVNGAVYTAMYDGPLCLQASEVEHGEWMDLDAVIELTQREAFCPDGIEALRLYLDRLNRLRGRQQPG